MVQNRTVKISLAIHCGLLNNIDELADRKYTTRSDILRMALIEFMKRPENAPRTPQALLEVLAKDKLQVLRQYQKGQITSGQLEEKGITWAMQLELMKMGEL